MNPYPKYKNSNIAWLGSIPVGWSTTRLNELFSVVCGATPKNEERFWNGKIAWITPADFKTSDTYVKAGRRFITHEGLSSCGTTLVPSDSIVISTRAPIGSVVINDKKLCTNQGCKSLVKRQLDSVLTKYYYYVLSITTESLIRLGKGATFLELSTTDLAHFRVPIPSLSEQHSIVNYLDRETAEMDALITEQEELVSLLKQKRAVIISEAVCRGLDPTVPLKDSGKQWIGKVPSHWQILKIKDIAVLRGGSGFPVNMQGDQGKDIPFHKVSSLGKSLNHILQAPDSSISEEQAQFLKATIFPENTIVFAKVGAALLLGRFCTLEEKSCIDNNMMGMIMKNDLILHEFALYALPTSIQFKFMVNPGAVPSINGSQIGYFKIPLPPIQEQQVIINYLDRETAEIDRLIADCESSIQLLKQRRTALISEVVTGKIDVRIA